MIMDRFSNKIIHLVICWNFFSYFSQVKVSVGKNSEGKDEKEYADELDLKGCDARNVKASTSVASEHVGDDENELVWEEGRVPVSENKEDYSYDDGREVTIEFTDTPSSSGKKLPRRFSAKDKVNINHS